MKLTINSFRRLKKIEIDVCNTVTLIAGKIEQGKTSLLQAIGAVTTSESMLSLLGLTEKQSLMLLHTGQPKSTIISETGEGMTGISFPDGKKVSEGIPTEISVWASGLKNILDEPVKTRSEIMAKILQSHPGKQMLFDELDKISSSEAGKKRIWETIELQGWDEAHNHARKTNTSLKALWENATGERYGSKKAEDWVPAAWDFDLTNAVEEDLKATVDDEKTWLEVAITSETIDEMNAGEVEEATKSLPIINGNISKLIADLTRSQAAYRNTKTALNALPDATQPTIHKCPNCNADLAIIDGTIQKHDTVEEDVIKKREDDLAKLNKSLEIIDSEITKTNGLIITAKAELLEVNKIIKDNSTERKVDTKVPKATADICRQYVAKAEERLKSFTSKKTSNELSTKIKTNQLIVDILAPTGLRLTTFEEKVKSFNSKLADISKISGWGEIYFNKNMTVNHRGWPYPHLISGSAQWRVRLALQIAIASTLDDKFILIDGADILDSDNRNNLIKLLFKLKVKAVVAMTVDSKEKVPDLSKLGGMSYWIEDGKI